MLLHSSILTVSNHLDNWLQTLLIISIEGKCQCCGEDEGECKGICDECRLS